MNRAEFEAKVIQNQKAAVASPQLYKWRVVLMAFGGYLYLGAIIVLLLAAIAALVGIAVFTRHGNFLLIKVGIVPLIMLGVVMRALWVHFPKPTGLRVTPGEAPELFARIESIQKKLGAPKVHQVLLVPDLNAFLAQRPRLGVFGWQENSLICGVAYMAATSQAGFESVIAHELGHLRHGDGRTYSWVARTMATWERLGESISSDASSAWLFKGFYDWWMPRLQAMASVFRRQQEYAADAAAVEWSGTQAAGETILLSQTAGEEAERRFWETMFKRSLVEPEAPSDPFTQFTAAMRNRSDESLMKRCIQEAFKLQTHASDTHPSMRERLTAIGFITDDSEIDSLAVPPPPEQSAAQILLGPALGGTLNHFDMTWRTPIAQKWKEQHAAAKIDLERLGLLEAKESLDVEEQVEVAQLHKLYRDPAAARERLKSIVEQHPDHAVAAYSLGSVLLEDRDAAGVALLERSMSNPSVVAAACRDLHQYYERTGQRERANAMIDRFEDHSKLQENAVNERLTFPDLGAIEPITEPYETYDKLVAWLQGDSKIAAAYLLKRKTNYRPDLAAYALLVVPKKAFFTLKNEQELHNIALANLVEFAPVTAETYLFVATGTLKKTSKLLAKAGIMPIVDKR